MKQGLSIVIVNWNTRELLRACLASIAGQGYETIVVDNASGDGSAVMVAAEFPRVRLIANAENVGFARANNQGIAVASGRYLLLLNSDTEVRGTALDEMVRYLDEHPDVGAAGGSLRNADGSRQFACDLFPLRPWEMAWQRLVNSVWPGNTVTRKGRMSRWTYSEPFDVDWVLGAALMVRREVVDRVGDMDANSFMYAEDLEWCYRFRQAGWRIVHLPDAYIYHVGGGSSKESAALRDELYRTADRSLIYFYRKHYGRLAALGLRLIVWNKWRKAGAGQAAA